MADQRMCGEAATIAAAVVLAIFTHSVSAQIFKCSDGKGHVQFQQYPCANGQRPESFTGGGTFTTTDSYESTAHTGAYLGQRAQENAQLQAQRAAAADNDGQAQANRRLEDGARSARMRANSLVPLDKRTRDDLRVQAAQMDAARAGVSLAAPTQHGSGPALAPTFGAVPDPGQQRILDDAARSSRLQAGSLTSTPRERRQLTLQANQLNAAAAGVNLPPVQEPERRAVAAPTKINTVFDQFGNPYTSNSSVPNSILDQRTGKNCITNGTVIVKCN